MPINEPGPDADTVTVTRFWLRAFNRPARDDEGFSLVEVIISLLIIGIVSTASAGFFVANIKDVNGQRQHQAAVYLADQQIETIQSLPVAKLVQGRTQASVNALLATAAATSLNIASQDDTTNAGDYDSTATGASIPTIPTSLTGVTAVTVNKVPYSLYSFIDVCWFAVTNGKCGPTSTAATVKEYRASVYVAWTAAGPCKNGCNYSTSTLIDPTADPTFNANLSQPSLLTGPTPASVNNDSQYTSSCTTGAGTTTGTEVVITATNLKSGVRVWISSGGGTISNIDQPTSSEVDFCLQSGDAPGSYTLSVINTDGGHFQTSITEVPGISSATGWTSAGKTLTLSGGGFESGATVTATNGATFSTATVTAGVGALDTVGLTNFSGPTNGGSTVVTVTNPDGTSDTFSITAPTETSYSSVPQSKVSGAWVLGQTTALAVSGTGLSTSTPVVTSGTGTVTDNFISGQEYLYVSGAAAGATLTVQLYNADGGKTSTFTITVHAAPTVTSRVPTTISAAATTTVTVTGTGFVAGLTATDTAPGTISVTSVNATTVVLSVNATTTGTDTITLTNTDGGTVTTTVSVTPTVTNITPTGTLRHATATTWTLAGTGFVTTGTTTVTLKEGATTLAVTLVSVSSTTALTFHATTTASTGSQSFVVTVTNPDGTTTSFTKSLSVT